VSRRTAAQHFDSRAGAGADDPTGAASDAAGLESRTAEEDGMSYEQAAAIVAEGNGVIVSVPMENSCLG